MSGQAASEIKDMLSTSQTQVKDFAQTSQKRINTIVALGRSKVRSGTEVADLCMGELDKILTSVNDLDSSIKEIDSAISEQSIIIIIPFASVS